MKAAETFVEMLPLFDDACLSQEVPCSALELRSLRLRASRGGSLEATSVTFESKRLVMFQILGAI